MSVWQAKSANLSLPWHTHRGHQKMGMMASLGFGNCPVLRKVKVGVFSTGDEVQAPGSEQKPNSIYDSNRFTIIGSVKS